MYYANDLHHRIDGVAHVWFWTNGQLKRTEYDVYDLTHRLDGPAVQDWIENGQLINEEYWEHGVRIEASDCKFVKSANKQ